MEQTCERLPDTYAQEYFRAVYVEALIAKYASAVRKTRGMSLIRAEDSAFSSTRGMQTMARGLQMRGATPVRTRSLARSPAQTIGSGSLRPTRIG